MFCLKHISLCTKMSALKRHSFTFQKILLSCFGSAGSVPSVRLLFLGCCAIGAVPLFLLPRRLRRSLAYVWTRGYPDPESRT